MKKCKAKLFTQHSTQSL